jgi:exosortase K
MSEKRANILIYLVAVAAIVGGLKWHYSAANVNDLRWILAPTTFIVESFTGSGFRFEPFFGYLSDDRTFLIAAPCAGVNFLIVCFLMLAVRKIREARLKKLPLYLLAAYGWTITANAARIVIALGMRSEEFEGWSDPETSHRVEGILVYFIFLVGLYYAAEKIEGLRSGKAKVPTFLIVVVPLMTYYFGALTLPILNGSFAASKWEHFLSVLLVPLVVALPLGILAAVRSERRDH